MKRIKKLASLLLAMVMVFNMGLMVFAAGETDLPSKPNNKDASLEGHTFKAYQIFTGTQDADSEKLFNIQWGDGVNASNFLSALQTSGDFGDSNPFAGIKYEKNAPQKSADAVARVISDTTKWSNDSDSARAFARIADQNKAGAGAIPGDTLEAGYYLVVDETVFDTDATETVKNLSILQMTIAHPFTPQNKTDVPELEKKVKEKNDSTEDPDTWGDVADYDINDDVEFVLTGTLPSDYDSYVRYKYVFHDTLSNGLSLNESSIIVKIDGSEVSESGYDYEKTGQSFTIKFADLKTNKAAKTGSVITVEYSAKLTGDAVVIGGNGNDNTAHLEYSNNPNDNGTGEPETGNTPEDKVVVFTYKLLANKKDEAGNALAGAGFTLYKYNAESTADDKYEPVGSEVKGVTEFEFKGIDAGLYKLVETTVPSGYNKADDMYFEVKATPDGTTTPPSVSSLAIEKVTDKDGNKITDSKGTEVFTFTGSALDGSLTTDIVNKAGILLPSTGGIGTTIFYVVGGILVIGAGILLVAKKRMGANK